MAAPHLGPWLVVLNIVLVILLLHSYASRPTQHEAQLQPVAPASATALQTVWTRKPGAANSQKPHEVSAALGGLANNVDRVDVYQNVGPVGSNKQTVVFAYRRSSCADWNRENPDKLFANEFFAVVSGLLKAGGTVVDIGACYGDTAVPLGILADKVIALEPNPKSFEILRLNAELNPQLNIRPHNVAAGGSAAPGKLKFTYGGGKGELCNGGVLGAWKDESTETAIEVDAVPVVPFLQQHYTKADLSSIKLVKIDAEGFDSSIVRTLGPLKQLSPGFLLLVEWFDYFMTSPPHGQGGPDEVHPGAKELFDAIDALGYRPFNPVTLQPVPGPQNKHKLPDLLCMPKTR